MEKRKSKVYVFVAMLVALLLFGCGALYTDIKTPMPSLSLQANADSKTKVGKASCTSYVWVVAIGDCSVDAAMKNGGINKIHHVDYEIKSIFFGIYGKHTIVVYGE